MHVFLTQYNDTHYQKPFAEEHCHGTVEYAMLSHMTLQCSMTFFSSPKKCRLWQLLSICSLLGIQSVKLRSP